MSSAQDLSVDGLDRVSSEDSDLFFEDIPACKHRLPVSALMRGIRSYGVSPHGDRYAVVALLDELGQDHIALACSKRFGSLSRLSEFEGLLVNLMLVRDGLQLRPLSEQVSPEIQLAKDR